MVLVDLMKTDVKILSLNSRCEAVFVILASIFGLVIMFITPPFQVPDELNHFFRAYQIAEGQFLPQKIDEKHYGGVLPVSLHNTGLKVNDLPFHPEAKTTTKQIRNLFKIPLNQEVKRSLLFNNTAPYSPVLYIPQAIGILIGRFLDLSPVALLYLGRFLNLILYVFLIAMAIRLAPFSKWVFFMLGLMPMSIFLGASLSADTYTIGLAFVLIAFIMKISFEHHKMDIIQSTILFILIFLTLFGKQGYFLLAGLYFLIPSKKFDTRKKYLMFAAIYFIFCIFIVILWHSATRGVTLQRSGVSPPDQIVFILSHPYGFMETLIKTIRFKTLFYLSSFIGTLGWMDVILAPGFKITYFVMLLAAGTINTGEGKLTYKNKSLLAAIWGGNSLLLLVMIYLWWNPVGDPSIYGIQGRYFIPLAPLFFLLFHSRIKLIKHSEILMPVILIAFSLGSLTYTVYMLVDRYYLLN